MLTTNRALAFVKGTLWRSSSIALILSLLFFSLALAASGALDTTFSGDGKVNTDVNTAHPGWEDKAFGLAIQTNGKIVVVGKNDNYTTSSDFAVTRYNSNGTLDTTFSGDGKQITNLGGLDSAYGVAIQSNNKIVVVGDQCNSSNTKCKLAVVRYNANGSLDTTFNGTGMKIVDFGGGNTASNGGLAIQPLDGKIVVAATAWTGTDTDFAVFRFNPNGSLDTTFNGSGKKAIDTGDGTNESGGWGRDLALQKDGKIVMSGGTGNGNFAVIRLNSNGTLDNTFSGDGKQITDFGGSDYSWALAIQKDGKIVVVGDKELTSTYSIAIARYNTNGSLDTTFNGSGKKTIDIPGSAHESARSVVIQPSNGKIIVCGTSDNNHGNFSMARLIPNGSLDTTFSGDGKATFDFNLGNDICRAIAIDANGKYVLAGYANVGGQNDFGVARVLP